jgi:outer membrane protein OmpA-like peptidoglycan-associated protein
MGNNMKLFITAVLSSLAFSVAAQGYVVSSDSQPVRDSSGQCVETVAQSPADVSSACNPPVGEPIQRIYHADVFFHFGQSYLTADAKEILDRVVDDIKNNNRDHPVSVVGHTDWIGNDSYNLILSQERARAVADYLRDRVALQYSVSGVGSREPLPFTVYCKDSWELDQLIECLSLNRRVEVDYVID